LSTGKSISALKTYEVFLQCCHEEDTESRSTNLTALHLDSQTNTAPAAKLQPASIHHHQPSSSLATQSQPAVPLVAEHPPAFLLDTQYQDDSSLAAPHQVALPKANKFQVASQSSSIVKGLYRHFLDNAAIGDSGESSVEVRKVPQSSPVSRELGYFAERQAIKGKRKAYTEENRQTFL